MSTNAWRIATALLGLAVLGSALGVVYGKHEARSRFNELQRLTRERDAARARISRMEERIVALRARLADRAARTD